MLKNVCIILFCLIAFSCNQTKRKTEKNEYPAYIVKSFMDGCLGDNSNPSVSQTLICSCLMDKIQKKYTVEQFKELSELQNGAKLDEYQDFLNKATEECLKNSTTK